MVETESATAPAAPLVGRRLLALLYDLFPALGLWFAVGASVLWLNAGVPPKPGSAAGWTELLALWSVSGLYAVLSWRRGGQTLGMRPWKLRVTAADGGRPGWPALLKRYAIGGLSLLLAGAGFWWAWFDHERLTWHDRASGTRLRRLP